MSAHNEPDAGGPEPGLIAELVRPSYIVTSTNHFWMCSLCGALLAHPSLPIHTDWHALNDGPEEARP